MSNHNTSVESFDLRDLEPVLTQRPDQRDYVILAGRVRLIVDSNFLDTLIAEYISSKSAAGLDLDSDT